MVNRCPLSRCSLPACRRIEAPALPDGDGLVLVVNEAGGSASQLDEVEKLLADLLPRAEVVGAGDDLEQLLREAAGRATVLGAMSGAGTINCAAGVALEAGLPLAVFPGGTLNHFAAELGIAALADTVKAVRSGSAVAVAVGSAAPDHEGLYFLNTFALGVYPELVKEREKHEKRLGKWPAMVLALGRVMRKAKPVTVTLDGQEPVLWTLFAGNGHYHPAGFAPSWRERLDEGCIDLRLIDACRLFSRTRLTAAVLTGLLGRSRVYEERIVGHIALSSPAPSRIARDGEESDGPSRLLLRAASSPLVVYRP